MTPADNNSNRCFARTNPILTPGPYDILCGRTSTAFNNVGNRRFRVTISLNLQRYLQAKNRNDRIESIISVVRLLRDHIGARFLKRRGNVWIELDENKTREKVGHALRDMAATQQQQQQQDKEDQNILFETTTNKSDLEETIENKKTTTNITKNNILLSRSENTVLDSLSDVCDDNDDDSKDPPALYNVQPFSMLPKRHVQKQSRKHQRTRLPVQARRKATALQTK
jgi:hypothetical protein